MRRETGFPGKSGGSLSSALRAGRGNLLLLYLLLLVSACCFVLFSPWQAAPFFPNKLVLTWRMIAFNLTETAHGRGSYAEFLWGMLVFFSLSAIFHASGRWLLKKILLPGQESEGALSAAELFAASWSLGSWICGLAWFVLGSLGLFIKPVAFLFAAGGAFLFLRKTPAFISKIKSIRPAGGFSVDVPGIALGIVGLWVLSWSAFSILPQYYWDTLMINLAIPGYYVAEARFIPNPFHVYTYFPQNSELLTVWALLLGSNAAAFLLVWGFFLALLFLIYGWLARRASRFAAFCAITLLVSAPLGSWLALYVKNDLQVALFQILQWWALLTALEKHSRAEAGADRWLFLSGLCAGVACGHKLSALPSLAATAAGVIAYFSLHSEVKWGEGRGAAAARRFGLYLAGCTLSFGPWMARGIILTGNPIYPFLQGLFHTARLHPWLTHPGGSDFSLLNMGPAGPLSYLRNLTQFHPEGGFGNARIWWGPGAWFCLAGFLCLSGWFKREIRWVSLMACLSWLVSLCFSFKPMHHAGPLIFMFCFALGSVIHAVLSEWSFAWLKTATLVFVGLNFVKNWLAADVKAYLALVLSVLLSGSPVWHYLSNMETDTPEYASVFEMDWVHHLINKYAGPNDKVVFVGSVRPAGIRRKHYAGLSFNMQPILYFAQQSKDAGELKEKLLSLGVRHIVFDARGWLDWVGNLTPDGPHNQRIEEADLNKVKRLLADDLAVRAVVPSGRLVWYTLRTVPGAPVPDVPMDEEDVYQYPFAYLMLARECVLQGDRGKAERISALLERFPFNAHIMERVETLAAVLRGR